MATALKTYSHLAQQKRLPTEYELVTSRLHYYVEKGFAVNVPLRAWYQRYQKDSPLSCGDWEKFYDPRETTYTKYTELQKTREAHVDGLLKSIETSEYDRRLSKEWLENLSRGVTPLRFVFHGFQMAAAYVGQMAPSGRITIAALLQAADELRRIQRLAYRMAQLRRVQSEFGETSKECWQTNSIWQPLRRTLEKLLITYDWGEAFVALNLCLKPLVDQIFMVQFADCARKNEDYLFGEILLSLDEDCQWQRDWTEALLEVVFADRPSSRTVIQQWVDRWGVEAGKILSSFASLLGSGAEEHLVRARAHSAAFLDGMGLVMG